MFRRSVQDIRSVLNTFLRQKGLETPLLQKRLMDAWPDVVGRSVVRYTSGMFIKNQTLFVKISSPALRADLSMRRTRLVKQLNDAVGAMVIADIKIY